MVTTPVDIDGMRRLSTDVHSNVGADGHHLSCHCAMCREYRRQRAVLLAERVPALLDELAAARVRLAVSEGMWQTYGSRIERGDERSTPVASVLEMVCGYCGRAVAIVEDAGVQQCPCGHGAFVAFSLRDTEPLPESADDAAATDAARTAKGWAHG